MNTILGIKQAQMQRFLENGTRIPVTVIGVPSNVVVSVKTLEKDGYQAVQIGMGSKKKANKPLLGHAKKANMTTAPKILKEVRTDETLPQGEFIAIASVLAVGDIVKVTGISKGKGFAGGVKRYGFRGGPRTHGQSDRERAPGSIGQTTTPGRVYKGKHMAGRMGTETVSVTNLVVVAVDETNNQILLKGLVPGNMGGIITITKTSALPEKKIVALLPDPFAPVVEEPQIEEPAEEEVTKETDVSGADESTSNVADAEATEESTSEESVILDETKQEETADAAAQPAEEKVAQAADAAEQSSEVEDAEEVKKEEENGGK